MVPATTSQTVGPYFSIGLSLLITADIAGPDVPGERFTLKGRALDANRNPIPDALIEIWQADAAGEYPNDGTGRFAGSDAWPRIRTANTA